MALGGFLPFGAIFYEAFYILSAIWHHQYFFIFGAVSMCVLMLMCAEVAIVMCYFQLCSEDYRWWWKAFLVPAAVGIYVLVYSLGWLISQMDDVIFSALILYTINALLFSATAALIAGAIGFYGTFAFILLIYNAVKVD